MVFLGNCGSYYFTNIKLIGCILTFCRNGSKNASGTIVKSCIEAQVPDHHSVKDDHFLLWKPMATTGDPT